MSVAAIPCRAVFEPLRQADSPRRPCRRERIVTHRMFTRRGRGPVIQDSAMTPYADRFRSAAARLAAGALLLLFATASAAQAQSTSTVVISQVYGGGGNTGAPFRNDFIELYNRGTEPVP